MSITRCPKALIYLALLLFAVCAVQLFLFASRSRAEAASPPANRAMLQAATATETATATATSTATTTTTITATVTTTVPAEVSPSATLTVNLTASATDTQAVFATFLPTTPAPPVDTPILVTTSLTATATLLPFPTITLQYPRFTSTPRLLAAERQPGLPALSKPEPGAALRQALRLWPCGLILFIWLFLGIWFVATQGRLGRRE
ncbi:MAG: hypothetical protein JXB15_18085 [Anaerolineales bacterium]|nr:hypothetical protein [Anaerolineales bacterium]